MTRILAMGPGGTGRFVIGWAVGSVLASWGVLAVHDVLYLAGLAVLALTTIGFAGGTALESAPRPARIVIRCGGLALVALGIVVPMLLPAPSQNVTPLPAADLGTSPVRYTPILATTEGVVRLGAQARTLDPAAGVLGDPVRMATPSWLTAPDGDVVLLNGDELARVSLDGDRQEATLDIKAPDGLRARSADPHIVALTKDTVVVGACTFDGACRLHGIGEDGDVTWTARTGWTGYLQNETGSRGRAPSQVVTNPSDGPRSVLDADTGEEIASIPTKENSQFMVVDDLLVLRTGEGQTCRYTVRRGADVVLDDEASCDGRVYSAARRGELIWLNRWDESDDVLVLDLSAGRLRTAEVPVPEASTLAGWDANLVEDGPRLSLVDRLTGDERWDRELGEHEVVGTSTDTVVVTVPGTERLLGDNGDRLLVLDAEDGSTLGELHVPEGSVQPRSDKHRGAGAVIGLPGGALVLWEDEDGAEQAAVVGKPRVATEADVSLDGYSGP